MLGFVAAVVAELKTGQSVWSQLAGKYVDGDLKEHAIGTATLGFGAIVALLTYASIAPMFQAGELKYIITHIFTNARLRARHAPVFLWVSCDQLFRRNSSNPESILKG